MINTDNSLGSRESKSYFLRERELAERWKTSQRTLQRWRFQDYGPPFVRIGGAIRYRLEDIEKFEVQMLRGGSDADPGVSQ